MHIHTAQPFNPLTKTLACTTENVNQHASFMPFPWLHPEHPPRQSPGFGYSPEVWRETRGRTSEEEVTEMRCRDGVGTRGGWMCG